MNRDTVVVICLAAGSAAAVGVVGLVLAYLVRRRSVRWAFAMVALCAVLGIAAGAIATAKEMFLSEHDFGVVLQVVAASGLVALAFSLLVARWAVSGSQAVLEATRMLGESGTFVRPDDVPAELAAVSDQLAVTSQRLTESRERERSLEASRRELISWTSHDLRTPLAGLRAMAEALEDGIAEDPARYHVQMRLTVDKMAQMVDDLFVFSRIHAGALDLTLEAVSLDEAISEVLAVSGPVARARGVELGGYAEPGVAVQADPRELSRMISNLVTNAIRHTPSAGRVEVTGRAGRDGVEVAVEDACGGIAPEDLDRVFDVAWRGSDARTPESAQWSAGSGLGLAIVRGIAEAHHGTVRVDNVDEGCRFLVQLPRAGVSH